MSISAIAYSARYFASKDELWISLGYLLPFVWFLFQKDLLVSLTLPYEVVAYFLISLSYFVAWYVLRPRENSRYQHIAAYVGALLALVFAIGTLFGDWHVYATLLVSYIGLIFALIYYFEGNKGERLLAAIAFTGVGGLFSLIEIYGTPDSLISYPTLFAIIGLIPAILLSPMANIQ